MDRETSNKEIYLENESNTNPKPNIPDSDIQYAYTTENQKIYKYTIVPDTSSLIDSKTYMYMIRIENNEEHIGAISVHIGFQRKLIYVNPHVLEKYKDVFLNSPITFINGTNKEASPSIILHIDVSSPALSRFSRKASSIIEKKEATIVDCISFGYYCPKCGKSNNPSTCLKPVKIIDKYGGAHTAEAIVCASCAAFYMPPQVYKRFKKDINISAFRFRHVDTSKYRPVNTSTHLRTKKKNHSNASGQICPICHKPFKGNLYYDAVYGSGVGMCFDCFREFKQSMME